MSRPGSSGCHADSGSSKVERSASKRPEGPIARFEPRPSRDGRRADANGEREHLPARRSRHGEDDRVERWLGREPVEHRRKHAGHQAGHVPGNDERELGRGLPKRTGEPGERPAEWLAVGHDLDPGHGSTVRWSGDEDLVGDLRNRRDRPIEERHPVERGPELVRAESRGAPAGQHDSRDARAVRGRRR